MKKTWIAFAALALLAGPSLASGVGGGITYWDADEAGDDNGIALRLELDLGPSWNLDLRAGFLDGHQAMVGGRTFLLEATPVDLGISYGFGTGGNFEPYVGGGLSYVLYDAEVLNSSDGARVADEPGWYAVVGVQARFARNASVYLEGLYRQSKAQIEGDGLASFDKVDVDFAGPAANVGVMLSW